MGQVARGYELTELGGGVEEGGGAEDSERFFGCWSLRKGAVVGEVEEVGYVDYYWISYLLVFSFR